MDLYRHMAHCHVALRLFLDLYPKYRCLIPMRANEVENDNFNYKNVLPSKMLQENNTDENFTLPNMSTDHQIRDKNTIYWCMQNLPRSPRQYRYSKRQHQEQYAFFKSNLDSFLLFKVADIYHPRIIIACNSLAR